MFVAGIGVGVDIGGAGGTVDMVGVVAGGGVDVDVGVDGVVSVAVVVVGRDVVVVDDDVGIDGVDDDDECGVVSVGGIVGVVVAVCFVWLMMVMSLVLVCCGIVVGRVEGGVGRWWCCWCC